MSKTIKGEFLAQFGTQEGYDAFLQCENIKSLRDSAGNEIDEFAALEDGAAYTAGPARVALAKQPSGEQLGLLLSHFFR